MNDKPKLILHIGTHKTATSTLQAIMEQNRAALIGQGFYYPATNRLPHPNLPKHTSLYVALMNGPDAVRAEREILLGEFEASGCTTMVLSEEGMSSPGFLRERAMERVQILAPDFDIRIISFLRRQDSFVESLWNQYTREKTTNKHINEFIKAPNPRQYMTYMDTLAEWAKQGEITAIGYETAVEAGIVEAFSAATGMSLPHEQRRTNVSPSMACAAMMAAMNRMGIAYDWRSIEAALGPDTRRYALGSRLRTRLLAQFAEHNARLRETYGVVFPDKMPDEPEEPIAEPGAEDIRRVIAVMQEAGDTISAMPAGPQSRPNMAKAGKQRKEDAARAGGMAGGEHRVRPAGGPGKGPGNRPQTLLVDGKRPKLLIHIGTHKTATSTLQLLMSTNRALMAEQGFHYARTDREPMPRNHRHAFFTVMLKSGGAPFLAMHKEMVAEFAATGCHTMVISEEGLAGPATGRKLAPLRRFARDFDIEVVCLLRRQDYFVESFWNFRCKLGFETKQIGDYIQHPQVQRYMTYLDMLGRWSNIGKVTVLGFESACDAGLIDSFGKATGFRLPDSDQTRNASSSMSLAAALAELNKEGFDFDWKKIEPMLGPNLRRTALGSRLRKELLARFADHNAELEQRYGVRFPDTMPEESEDPVTPPSAEEIARIRATLRARTQEDDIA